MSTVWWKMDNTAKQLISMHKTTLAKRTKVIWDDPLENVKLEPTKKAIEICQTNGLEYVSNDYPYSDFLVMWVKDELDLSLKGYGVINISREQYEPFPQEMILVKGKMKTDNPLPRNRLQSIRVGHYSLTIRNPLGTFVVLNNNVLKSKLSFDQAVEEEIEKMRENRKMNKQLMTPSRKTKYGTFGNESRHQFHPQPPQEQKMLQQLKEQKPDHQYLQEQHNQEKDNLLQQVYNLQQELRHREQTFKKELAEQAKQLQLTVLQAQQQQQQLQFQQPPPPLHGLQFRQPPPAPILDGSPESNSPPGAWGLPAQPTVGISPASGSPPGLPEAWGLQKQGPPQTQPFPEIRMMAGAGKTLERTEDNNGKISHNMRNTGTIQKQRAFRTQEQQEAMVNAQTLKPKQVDNEDVMQLAHENRSLIEELASTANTMTMGLTDIVTYDEVEEYSDDDGLEAITDNLANSTIQETAPLIHRLLENSLHQVRQQRGHTEEEAEKQGGHVDKTKRKRHPPNYLKDYDLS